MLLRSIIKKSFTFRIMNIGIDQTFFRVFRNIFKNCNTLFGRYLLG